MNTVLAPLLPFVEDERGGGGAGSGRDRDDEEPGVVGDADMGPPPALLEECVLPRDEDRGGGG